MTVGKRIVLQVGIFFMFLSLFSIGAFAEGGGGSAVSAVITGMVGALIVGLITSVVLISMSRTKQRSTQADHYVSSDVSLSDKTDRFLRKETRRVSND